MGPIAVGKTFGAKRATDLVINVEEVPGPHRRRLRRQRAVMNGVAKRIGDAHLNLRTGSHDTFTSGSFLAAQLEFVANGSTDAAGKSRFASKSGISSVLGRTAKRFQIIDAAVIAKRAKLIGGNDLNLIDSIDKITQIGDGLTTERTRHICGVENLLCTAVTTALMATGGKVGDGGGGEANDTFLGSENVHRRR